jgi:hypothetical protein
MDVSRIGMAYAMRMEKISQNVDKAQGEAAVKLIDSAKQPPPPGVNGEGMRVNTYA